VRHSFSASDAGSSGSSAEDRPVIAVCGSLFAAAEAREALFAMEPSLFNEADWVRMQDMI
jgi:hypothetical protein